MAAVALLAAWRSKEPVRERLGLVPQSGRVVGRFKLATLAAFTTSVAYATLVFSALFMGPPPEGGAIANVITDGSWLMITLASIVLSVIPALVEEALFRGYLQRRFLKRWSPRVAITVSTLLFAVMHMDSWQHIIAVIPLGAVLGLLAYRTNSIKPGMLVHAIHNTAAVGFASLATALEPFIGVEALGLGVIGTIGVLGLIGLPAVISLLRKSKASATKPAEPLSVRRLELELPEFGFGSELTGTAA
jgi:membrane protease YdiL (CAAX protease family)